MRLTGQLGVPVITDGQDVVVGFDPNRLKAMADRSKRRGLGLRVANAPGGGALVGSVREDSPAGRAGLESGDIVVELSGRPVQSADDLEAIAATWPGDRPTSLTYLRGEERKTAILYG